MMTALDQNSAAFLLYPFISFRQFSVESFGEAFLICYFLVQLSSSLPGVILTVGIFRKKEYFMGYTSRVGSRDMMKSEICRKQSAFETASFSLFASVTPFVFAEGSKL